MKKRTLEIDEDLGFQDREWRWQSVGTIVLLVFVAAAALGLTGAGGVLSHGEAGERGGALHVEYERVVRRGAGATLTLHVRGSTSGDIKFWIAESYFHHASIEAIAPQPEAVSVEQGRQVYTIRAGSPEATIVIEINHRTFGRVQGEMGVVGGPSVHFRQVSLF